MGEREGGGERYIWSLIEFIAEALVEAKIVNGHLPSFVSNN